MISHKKVHRSQSTQDCRAVNVFEEFGVPDEVFQRLLDTNLADRDNVKQIISMMHIRRLSAGDLLMREGTLGKSIFIVLQGSVVILSEIHESEIGELGPGNVLGEIGGLLDVPRTMTVRAIGAGCTVGVLMREDVLRIPSLSSALIELAKKRLEADALRDEQILLSLPSKRIHLNAKLTALFGVDLSRKSDGKFVSRSDQSVLALIQHSAKVFILEGSVIVKYPISEKVAEKYEAGMFFEVEDNPELIVIQATGNACIYYTDARSKPAPHVYIKDQLVHKQSRETFEASIEQAARLSQIIASNSHRRSSIAVWSDESFLRTVPLPNDSSGNMGKFSVESIKVSLDDDASSDVIELLEEMGVPAREHRHQILSREDGENLSISLDSIHQYFDNDMLEAILMIFGSKVVSLSLRDCWTLSDSGLARIFSSCPNIRQIFLSNCWSLSEAGFQESFKLAPVSLIEIEVKNCPGLTGNCIQSLAHLKLSSINISNCKNLGDETWASLAGFEKSLEKLVLKRCSKISGESIISALGKDARFENLKVLDLSDCSFLSDDSVCAIVAVAPILQTLDISFCLDLDMPFFEKLARANITKSLTQLIMQNCSTFVTDEACLFIAETWKNIELLDARGCTLLTETTLEYLSSLEKLKDVDLSCCPNISPSALASKALGRSWKLTHPPSAFE